MNIELELKYRAEPAMLEAMEADYPNGWRLIQMETAYYDTPDFALSKQKITLRRRLENGEPVCTLKLPGKGAERREFELNEQDIHQAFPKLCHMAGLPLPEAAPVYICGARFTRKAMLMSLMDFSAELAIDRGVLIGKNVEMPLLEVELELKSGGEELLYLFGGYLQQRYGLVQETESKFARALSLLARM